MDENKTGLLWEAKRQAQTVRAYSEAFFAEHGHFPAAYTRTYGCQQNVSDTERLRGLLREMGYRLTEQIGEADFIIMNTCAVRENAEDRVFGHVGALKGLKKKKPELILALCGCMTQQPAAAEKLRAHYPYVDIIFGANAAWQLPGLLRRALEGQRGITELTGGEEGYVEGLPTCRDGKVRAFLPIMQGCDNFCSYCIVPHVRGREHSRPLCEVLGEARALIEAGYREITLLGQNVNSYGKGLSDGADFPLLLHRLNEIEGDFRIRFMTSHPKDCSHALIDAIARCEKVCSHIHLPVQSGSDRVLERMNRHYTGEKYRELIAYARERIPGVSFTSDIIVGFPGESYEDFKETLALIKEVRFHSLYTFIFSPRSGTAAAGYPDPVSPEEKGKWFRELLKLQEQIGAELYRREEGRTLRVLLEGPSKTEGMLTGHTGSGIIVECPGDASLIGQFRQVKITRALNWALLGEIIPPMGAEN
ncbi:MAG: tRNA (N6-isopentenyl adenosine(37)-C2)-methylthiotransferase MiaB [Provencibacterium sp.]|jgi:tRNA-2-methylthio-N6-dimethylallyladenosine synthase|nr:tRNA (N6-isopentenyl adenosine(37)-C2)-methylthiotransferase MiaB [Provencibacterium sp.]